MYLRDGYRRFATLIRLGLFLGVLLVCTSMQQVSAQSTPQAEAAQSAQLPPEEIVARMSSGNRSLRSFQSHVYGQFRLRSFPFVRDHIDGTAYFKRPDNYEIVFTHVPSYARGFGRLSADISDPSRWTQRYVISVSGLCSVGDHKDISLHLVSRIRGQIDHEDVFVDPRGWSIDEMQWHYYNRGTITMRQRYVMQDGYRLIAAQDAVIALPYVRAVAHAEYTAYQTNVMIADAVFTEKRR